MHEFVGQVAFLGAAEREQMQACCGEMIPHGVARIAREVAVMRYEVDV